MIFIFPISFLSLRARLRACPYSTVISAALTRGRRTRLHAKAWIFHRATGFGSAYVGSANLSGAALAGGLEWTVKFTERGENALFQRAKAHFETLWNDSEFQTYHAADPAHRAALNDALRRESGEQLIASPGFFDIQPKSYQQEMLDELSLERQRGRNRNLVVAATGTGKTVVAAFDYRRTCQLSGGRPRLLFVAHREEILRQALRTYREVLRDHSFGELLMHGRDLASFDHVFGVINSVKERNLPGRCGPDYWHTVVVDECHRLAADSFHEFVTTVRPQILLGLTATPERSDGKPILPYFDNRPDGSPAVELRLWHALDLQLVSPFEYYGCDDDTDFTEVPWNQPGELAAIERIVTGNDIRARLIIDEWRRLTADPKDESNISTCLKLHFDRDLKQRAIISNREVEIRLRLGPKASGSLRYRCAIGRRLMKLDAKVCPLQSRQRHRRSPQRPRLLPVSPLGLRPGHLHHLGPIRSRPPPRRQPRQQQRFSPLATAGKLIHLPSDPAYHPHPEALDWHRQERFGAFARSYPATIRPPPSALVGPIGNEAVFYSLHTANVKQPTTTPPGANSCESVNERRRDLAFPAARAISLPDRTTPVNFPS